MRRAEAQSGDRAERSLRAAMFQAGRGAGDGLGRAREGVGALPGPAASTRREGREDARGAGWRLDRASMTSSPPSPTEAAGFFWHLSPKTSRDYSAAVNMQIL